MRRIHLSIVKVGLLTAALAMVVVLVGRGDSPAEATTYNPSHTVNVSDPTPGANADLIINFSLSPPDSFPNTTTSPSVQFIPHQWGISPDAPIGAIGGTFNALSTIGILASLPCVFPTSVPFTMFNASTDTSRLTSPLDLGKGDGPGGTDAEPGGLGYSGQFVASPDNPNLRAGVTHYPDFLVQMFPDAGEPLTRLWGGRQVLVALVSLNLVTFDKGALPGFPPSMGYPTVTVLLDPVAPPELFQNSVTNVTCTPLALTNTTFGLTQDNPATAADESGFPALTNPSGQKDHVFTQITHSDFDADDDGIENWLDTCDLAPNTVNGILGIDNGRFLFGGPGDTDADGLNEACDPDPASAVINPNAFGLTDQDLDAYANVSDNCPLAQNGWALWDFTDMAPTGFGFEFFSWAVPENPVGPNEQLDSDRDRIGDVCDPDPLTPTGHTHQIVLERTVSIFKHGVKLNALGGPNSVADSGARTYSVDVSNLSDTDSEDIPVALRVAEGCATVNGVVGQNSTVVTVGPELSGSAEFTVDWTGCAAGDYTVQADACHAGDAAPAGFFGSGACPGASDGNTDNNPLDDAPRSKIVSVGSP